MAKTYTDSRWNIGVKIFPKYPDRIPPHLGSTISPLGRFSYTCPLDPHYSQAILFRLFHCSIAMTFRLVWYSSPCAGGSHSHPELPRTQARRYRISLSQDRGNRRGSGLTVGDKKNTNFLLSWSFLSRQSASGDLQPQVTTGLLS